MKAKLHFLVIFIVSTNFLLDINDSTKTLDSRNYSDGLYKVILVVDGKISDTKTLLKN